MKNIIVTGSSRGIGKCLVENLAKEGNNVLLNYNKSEKQALQIQRELKEDGFLIEIFKADVSKKSEVKSSSLGASPVFIGSSQVRFFSTPVVL